MAQTILTPEGAIKMKEELRKLVTEVIPGAEQRLKEARLSVDRVKILEAETLLEFNQGRAPQLKEMLLSDIRRRNCSPIYEGRTDPEQILVDKIKLWRQMIESEREDMRLFDEYETHVVQVALLTASQALKLESDIAQHERDLVAFIEDAKLMGITEEEIAPDR